MALCDTVDTVTPETSSGESPAEYATEIPPQYDVACAISSNNTLPSVQMRVDNRYVMIFDVVVIVDT